MTKYKQLVKLYGPKFMQELSLTQAQVAGLFGNFAVETGYFTLMQEVKPVVAGSRGGYGWAQWTGPRRREYEEYCKKNQLNPASDEANYRFVVYEFTHKEAKALTLLRQTTTVKAAAETVCLKYERPGIPHMDRRIKAAEEAYLELKGTKPVQDVAVAGGTVLAGTAAATAFPDWAIPVAFFAILALLIYAAVRITNEEDEKKEALNEADVKKDVL